MKKLLTLGAVFALAACSDADGARRAVESMGFTNVQLEGYRFFGCGEHDVYHTGFSARDARGNRAAGVVCAGWLKGSTVRFD